MTQIPDMTDQQLNRELAEKIGYKVIPRENTDAAYEVLTLYRLINHDGKDVLGSNLYIDEDNAWSKAPDYCTDPAASLEVQAAAIAKDPRGYGINLAKLREWEEDGDPLSYSEADLFSYEGVCVFLTASDRERAMAAWMTLSQADEQ